MNLTKNQTIIAFASVGVVIVVLIIGIYFAFIKKDTPTATIKPTATINPTTTIKATNTPTLTNTPIQTGTYPEVYYADKGGANDTRYAFTSMFEADAYAKSLGGTLATIEQIRNAHINGMDNCWFGWASNGNIYTISQSSHGPGSGCEGNTIGVSVFTNVSKAGAWVYGVKPSYSSVVNCATPNAGKCILPFSKNKWSQY